MPPKRAAKKQTTKRTRKQKDEEEAEENIISSDEEEDKAPKSKKNKQKSEESKPAAATTTAVDTLNIRQLFAHYAKIGKDDAAQISSQDSTLSGVTVSMDGCMQLVQDLGLKMEDLEALMVMYKLQCKTPFTITRDEFVKGFSEFTYVCRPWHTVIVYFINQF